MAPSEDHPLIASALEPFATLNFVNSCRACRRILSARIDVALVIAIPSTAFPSSDFLKLRAMKQEFPSVTCVGLLKDGRAIWEISNAVSELGAVVIKHEWLTQPSVLQSIIAQWENHCAAVWRLADVQVGDAFATLLRAALRLAHEPIRLDRFALATEMHERTLRKYCERYQLPSPQWIIGWARCLLAAYYLDDCGRSIQSIASLLKFSSPVLLANHLRRYTGMTATKLRAEGALASVARKLELARYRSQFHE